MDEALRLAIVGAGGYGRLALDVLIASGLEAWIIGFYDDAHAILPDKVRGFPVLGDIGVLKSMLSVEAVQVIVAITDNVVRLRIANSIRALGAQFFTAVHPAAYVSAEARVGVRAVLGQNSSVERKAVVQEDAQVVALSSVDRGGA